MLEDGDVVSLGDAALIAVLPSGHTRGCTSWRLEATDVAGGYEHFLDRMGSKIEGTLEAEGLEAGCAHRAAR